MTSVEKLAALRSQMKENGIDAYIILSPDAHSSEYVCSHWSSRAWLSGFNGSAGTVAVTMDKAGLWTDGRYFIQAENQLKDSTIDLFKMNIDGVPAIQEWLKDQLPKGAVVGFDGRTISYDLYNKYMSEFKKNKITTKFDVDLIDKIWKDRPALPLDKVYEHSVEFAGKSRIEKLNDVRAELKKEGAESCVISSLDDIAWLFNIRGTDVPFTPVVYAYSFITMDKAYLFINATKLEPKLKACLESDGVIIKDYNEIIGFLKGYDKQETMFLSPDRISISIKNSVPDSIDITEGIDITTKLKAVKNLTEIENLRKSQIRDGVATIRLIKWVKENVGKLDIEEADIHDKINSFRKELGNFIDASFPTIAGYMPNAALMHYNPLKGKSAKLKPEGMLLVDTGGQYFDGTTDITRTFALGEIPEEMKKDFTIVLKSHISLATAKFLYGAGGNSLDILARKPMWDLGLDYKCGTGHGLGYLLSVHEGPQNFRYSSPYLKLEAGMLLTNEPGIYKKDVWGIRIENTMLVVKDYENENGSFMRFETVSPCPIELNALKREMLTNEEAKWLNEYHADVYNKLSPFLSDDEKTWLKHETRAI